jgi:Cell division protein CrgA
VQFRPATTTRPREGSSAVPKSKVRKKSAYTPPEGVLQSRSGQARALEPSPRWFAPLMVTLMLIGLLWIVVFYVAGEHIPLMVTLGPWNFAIGFGAMVAGLVMSMRWR